LDEKYVLALDEGTTSARAILFDNQGNVKGVGQRGFPQLYPEPGWVEHDPRKIWGAQMASVKEALYVGDLEPGELAALALTNQRETSILWDRETGAPVCNAIVWQCRRTADAVESLKAEYGSLFKNRTGLIPDSYFSGPKVAWMLDNLEGLRERAERGEILFGTVDSYLLYRLTGGKVHATDYSNASRTLMFDIHRLEWSSELLEILDVPDSILPDVRPSSDVFGYTDPRVFGDSVPVSGIAGDQQAALFGHSAFDEGESKCTYGTGNFLLMNTGVNPVPSDRLLTTIAWGLGGEVYYALEGSVFVTGAAIQWLRDSLMIIGDATESETLARTLDGNDGVYFVPALTGLGAPYWDQYARGAITGITRGTGRAHLARAALEAIAYLTRDVVDAMEIDSGLVMDELRVDGGAAMNDFLMQFQADMLGATVVRPREIEATAKGAAYLAGLAVDFWSSLEDLEVLHTDVEEFKPVMGEEQRERLYAGWRNALSKVFHSNGMTS
jgi:glycerol kinase